VRVIVLNVAVARLLQGLGAQLLVELHSVPFLQPLHVFVSQMLDHQLLVHLQDVFVLPMIHIHRLPLALDFEIHLVFPELRHIRFLLLPFYHAHFFVLEVLLDVLQHLLVEWIQMRL
jgi:hypothetical protein